MKNLLLSACCLVAFAANAEEYRLVGQRHLRLYSAAEMTQAYNAAVDAQTVADSLCSVPWTVSRSVSATSTSHVNEQLDANVEKRDQFDAALFCAYHTNGTHKAFANAAVYRYRLPDGQLPNLTRLSARVSSDPYNASGARIVLYTNESGIIPTDCATCRGENAGGIKLAGLAQRITRRAGDGKDYWYPASTNAVFDLSSSPLQLQRYLFVFVLLENYASSRGNWLEGCSYIENLVSITTDEPITGWAEGSTVDLSLSGPVTAPDEWMPRFETTNTIITAVREGVTEQFSAPEHAWRLVHFGSTNLTLATHRVSQFDGEVWTRGAAVTNPTGWTVTQVLKSRRVSVSGRDVFLERGFESAPPSIGDVRTDSDGDGIPDGWEIYVGSDPNDPSDATSDWDGDGLTLAEEYAHGENPTNPRAANSFGDCMSDLYLQRYNLADGMSARDDDGDGLSNYAEYLINEVFHHAITLDLDDGSPLATNLHFGVKLDPFNPKTNTFCPDYFNKMGDLYLGFVFTDHDQIDAEWESRYPSAANPDAYDPYRDDDLDGWDNLDEFRAGTDPTDATSRPTPTVELDVVYNGKDPFSPPLIVKAWNESADPDCVYMPDAIWTITNDVFRYHSRITLTAPTGDCLGRLRKGSTTFLVYAADSDGAYTPGNPLGVVRGVDVGWKSAKLEVELKNVSPVCTRFSIKDRVEDPGEVRIEAATEDGQYNIYTKTFPNLKYRDFICELDLLRPGANGIDRLMSTAYERYIVVTNWMAYVVEMKAGLSSIVTNKVASDGSVQSPRCDGVIGGGGLTPAGCVHTAHPTFVWSMPGEFAELRELFGCTYTAFQLRIHDADGHLVYESDVTRAPKQDAAGRFVWTAPVSVGDQTPQGKVFANNASYTWDVAMFNAKFRPGPNAQWSQSGSFSTSVNAQQSQNDAGFSSIGVAVKYTGPSKVLYDRDTKTWLSDDLTKTNGKVRVQAFATADFSGVPACETYVADHVALTDVSDVFTNAVLKGLAAGTYYIRAYIDSNGNFRKDDFESWGCAKEPVTVGPAVIRLPAVGLYIEDADTNGNWYPDAWEYQYLNRGRLTWEDIYAQEPTAPREDGEIVLAKAVYDQMVGGVAGFSSGMMGSKFTIFQDAKYAELLLDPKGEWETVTTTIDAIRKAVHSNITERVGHDY